ncbi:UNVERIFIED_CONTAM: hypothetical protein POZ17_22145 [Ralstonia mannitolilytica]
MNKNHAFLQKKVIIQILKNESTPIKLQFMVIISSKKVHEIDLTKYLRNTESLVIQKNPEKKITYELVRDYMHILEKDNNVISYCEQPFKVNYFFKNIIKEFVPDYYVKYKNDKEELIILNVGTKEASELLEIEKTLQKNTIKFSMLHYKDIDSNLLFNYKFLSNYYHKGRFINDMDIQTIFTIVDKFKKLTVSQLLEEVGKTFERKAEILYVTWYLINSNLLNFNKEEKLSLKTIIWDKHE